MEPESNEKAPSPVTSPPPQQEHHEQAAKAASAHREAVQYWGYLFKSDKCGTPLLDRLLKGVADIISKQFEPSDSPDLTPSQIAAWYRSVGGNYDVLFVDTPPSQIAFIYRALGAFHSLQPAPKDDGYVSPSIPALKKQGFVTWQTIQLLLGPEEHVPFLQKAIEKFDVVDPETGNVFPKLLPKECFPDRPDDAMEAWYQGVATKLKQEAEAEAVAAHVDEPGPRTSTTDGEGSSADEKRGAFMYFEDPMYRKVRPRPTFVRYFSKQTPYDAEDQSRAVTSKVRHMPNPFSRRRSIPPGHYDDSFSDEDATPLATNPPPTRYTIHKRPQPPRRESTLSTTDSDSEPVPPSRRRSPDAQQRRSHEHIPEPREYFPAHYDDRLYSHSLASDTRASPPHAVYGPTKSPLFATQVARLEARNYYESRPRVVQRTSGSYRSVVVPQNERYGSSAGREVDVPYARDREREYEERGGSSRKSHSHRHRRRSMEDAAYARERDRERERERDVGRTRSHDGRGDDWAEGEGSRDRSRDGERERRKNWGDDRSRDGSRERDRDRDWERERDRDRDRDRDRNRERERDRDRDRDRDRRTHRYVASVQDGVGGRRYPVSKPY